MKTIASMPPTGTHRMRESRSLLRRLVDRGLVVGGTVGLTLAFFLVLPLIQAISQAKGPDTILQTVDVASLPPPPPPPEPEPEKEEEKEPEPPEMNDDAPPPDLSQLEMALGDGGGSGVLGGGFSIAMDELRADMGDAGGFSMGNVDQEPRPTYQPGPQPDAKLRKRAPGTVWLLFVVTDKGRVKNPIVQASTDPIFEKPALAAIKKWRFEPGKKNGKPVSYRMKLPFTFGKGG